MQVRLHLRSQSEQVMEVDLLRHGDGGGGSHDVCVCVVCVWCVCGVCGVCGVWCVVVIEMLLGILGMLHAGCEGMDAREGAI
jgi:hypothetical protein